MQFPRNSLSRAGKAEGDISPCACLGFSLPGEKASGGGRPLYCQVESFLCS